MHIFIALDLHKFRHYCTLRPAAVHTPPPPHLLTGDWHAMSESKATDIKGAGGVDRHRTWKA